MANSPFICFQPAPQPAVRLYCFPFAGGSAAVYRHWGKALAPDVEVWAAQLPGRGSRYREKAFFRLGPLVASLAALPLAADGRPFAFFGHSLGALVAFELARFLRRQGDEMPIHLFVSACRAPQLPDPRPPLHGLPPEQMLLELQDWNGIPEELLAQPEVMSFFLPVLRADLTVAETAVYLHESPLAVPIIAFGGSEDPLVSREELAAWRHQTSRSFQMHYFSGDHFYLQETNSQPLIELVQQLLVAEQR